MALRHGKRRRDLGSSATLPLSLGIRSTGRASTRVRPHALVAVVVVVALFTRAGPTAMTSDPKAQRDWSDAAVDDLLHQLLEQQDKDRACLSHAHHAHIITAPTPAKTSVAAAFVMATRTETLDSGPQHRLPNLFEVLSRRTTPPVDLYSFYIYMRDVQRSVDYLDFWLDVSQHMSLCRHYVRELRRSVLVSTPDLDKSGSKRSSQILDSYANLDRSSSEQGPSGFNQGPREKDRQGGDERLSAFLRNDNGSGHSPHNSEGSRPSAGDISGGAEQPPRPSFMTANSGSPAANSNSPQTTVARADIRASAEKILYTYLLPGAEREIILPQGILNDITDSIEKEGRDDPEVFDTAKDYVFQAMERDAFPGFLRAKALGNIVQPSMLLRLIVGLVAIFTAFWAAFILIFLDESRATRCWLILPFTLGIYLLASHQYILDPLLALAGFSEYTFMHFVRVKEPFVRQLLNKRALMCLMWIAIIDVALCCLFIFVPGKRL